MCKDRGVVIESCVPRADGFIHYGFSVIDSKMSVDFSEDSHGVMMSLYISEL